MNRHFKDAMYYARRTAESTYDGLRFEADPYVDEVLDRYYDYRGIERPAEPSRVEMIQAELDELPNRATVEAREVAQTVRHRIGGQQSQQ